MIKWMPLSMPVLLLFIVYKVLQSYRQQKRLRQLCLHQCPVILVPGLGGSRLYDKSGNLKWCHWQGFLPHVSNSWRDDLTVRFNPNTLTFAENEVVTPYRQSHWVKEQFQPTPDFGGVEGVGNVLSKTMKSSWQFQGLMNMCHTCTLYGAPYDFRKITSPRVWHEYCRSLKALIEHTFTLHQTGVILVTHSMGSPLMLTFLVKYLPTVVMCAATWKKKFIKRWVTVNGAFGGAGKAVRSFFSGDNNGMGYICDTGCHDWYQPLLENAAGILWMLPHPTVFEKNVPLIQVQGKGYNASQIIELMETVSPTAAAAYKSTVLPLLTLEAPGVPVVSLTSTQKGTPLQCVYSSSTSFHHTTVSMRDEREYYKNMTTDGSSVEHMCGDGTVPYLSLMVPQRWLDQQTEPVTFVRLNQENVGHTSILIEQEPLKTLMSLIA